MKQCLDLLRKCQTRLKLLSINSGEALFYPFLTLLMIHYARVRVLDKLKNMNVKVFNLISVVNEIRLLVQHLSCECKVD